MLIVLKLALLVALIFGTLYGTHAYTSFKENDKADMFNLKESEFISILEDIMLSEYGTKDLTPDHFMWVAN